MPPTQANENAAQESGGKLAVKDDAYTLERNRNGSVTVRINSDILDGKPQSTWPATVREAIKSIFSNGIQLPKGTVLTNRKGRGEYTNGSYTRMLEQTDPELYEAKMKMAPGTGAMVENAANVTFENPAHKRDDDIVGFNRGNIRVIVGGGDYTGDVLTAIYTDGKETFFDINNLQRNREEASSERYAAENSGFSQTDNASFKDIIRDTPPKSNTQNGKAKAVSCEKVPLIRKPYSQHRRGRRPRRPANLRHRTIVP